MEGLAYDYTHVIANVYITADKKDFWLNTLATCQMARTKKLSLHVNWHDAGATITPPLLYAITMANLLNKTK